MNLDVGGTRGRDVVRLRYSSFGVDQLYLSIHATHWRANKNNSTEATVLEDRDIGTSNFGIHSNS
jgi:hypothetical protein